MIKYIKKRLNEYWDKKSWFSKLTDLLFILLLIAMLIPASRKSIRIAASRVIAFSPKTISEENQTVLEPSTYDWVIFDLNGNSVPFSQFRGQAVFLNFWATWCAPCIAEMPDIQDLYNDFGDQAAFVLVSDESPERIRHFMEQRKLDMPVYVRRGGVPHDFASNSIPVTYVISPQGQVVIRKSGVAKWNSKSMQQLMQQLVGQSVKPNGI